MLEQTGGGSHHTASPGGSVKLRGAQSCELEPTACMVKENARKGQERQRFDGLDDPCLFSGKY